MFRLDSVVNMDELVDVMANVGDDITLNHYLTRTVSQNITSGPGHITNHNSQL